MVVMLLIGLVLLATGLFFLYDYQRFVSRSMELPGKLIAVAQHELHQSSGKVDITYHPVIEYSYDKTRQFRSPSGYSGYLPFRIGDAIPVLVDNDEPRQVRVKSRNNFYAGLLLLIAGIVLALIAGANLWVNGSYFSIAMSIGFLWVAFSRLKSSFLKITAKLQRVIQSDPNVADTGLAWEKSQPPADAKNWLYDTSGINSKSSHAVFAVIFLLLGLMGLGGGGYLFQDQLTFISSAETAEGSVTSVDIQVATNPSTNNTQSSYFPSVEFTTADGKTIEFRSDVGGDMQDYMTGDKVQVLYLPEQPENALIDLGVITNYAGAILLLAFGGMLFFIGVLMIKR